MLIIKCVGLGEMGKAIEEQEVDKKDEKTESPGEEMEKLEEEVSRYQLLNPLIRCSLGC